MFFNCKPLARQISEMKLRGIKQRELCLKAGIPQCKMSTILTGKRLPSMGELIKLCMALDCTPNDIIGRD